MNIPYVDRIGKPAPYKLPRKMKKAQRREMADAYGSSLFLGPVMWHTRLHWVPCQGWFMTYSISRHSFSKGRGLP